MGWGGGQAFWTTAALPVHLQQTPPGSGLPGSASLPLTPRRPGAPGRPRARPERPRAGAAAPELHCACARAGRRPGGGGSAARAPRPRSGPRLEAKWRRLPPARFGSRPPTPHLAPKRARTPAPRATTTRGDADSRTGCGGAAEARPPAGQKRRRPRRKCPRRLRGHFRFLSRT